MAKYCDQCPTRAAGIPCEEDTDLCVGLDTADSIHGVFSMRVCAGVNCDAERLRAELAGAADEIIDSLLGEEPDSRPAYALSDAIN